MPPLVCRAYIPKGDGRSLRPIGIPIFEDKVLQLAVAMVLEAVYEADFRDCSYSFRPGRSALQALREGTTAMKGGCWVVEVDIQSFFDELGHRSQRGRLSWEAYQRLLDRYPLPPPKVVHSVYGPSAKPMT